MSSPSAPAPAHSVSPKKDFDYGRAGATVLLVAALLWSVRLARAYTSIGHDQSWFLYAARLVLHGVRIAGPHLSETNPPLILWFSALPVLLAHVLSMPIALGFFLFTLILAAGSSLWCFWLLRTAAPNQGRLQRLLLTASIFFIECHVPWFTDFGQREQFLVIFLMPLLVSFGWPRLHSLTRRHVIAVSVVAAFGICLKPQHLVTLAALYASFLFFNRRSLRAAGPVLLSIVTATLVFCAYVVAVYLSAPDYLLHVVPLLRNTYWAFGTQSALQILLQRRFLLFLVVSVGVYFFLRKRCGLSWMPLILLIGCAGAHAAFALQRAGWIYQEIPQNALVVLFCLWLSVEILSSRYLWSFEHSRVSLRRSAGFTALVLILITLYFAMNVKNPAFMGVKESPDSETGTKGLFDGLAPQTPVFVFSTDLLPAFPAVLEDDLVWAGRSPHLWRLPAIVQNEADPTGVTPSIKHLPVAVIEQMATGLREDVAADLNYWHPAYVLVPRCTQATPCAGIVPRDFRMLDWFNRGAAFQSAWAAYTYDRAIPDVRLNTTWDVYRLKTSAAQSAEQSPLSR